MHRLRKRYATTEYKKRRRNKVFGRRKSIPPRGIELAQDRGEFRPGLYDRDIHDLRAALRALDRKIDAVLNNQVKLDELIRKVGLVTEREARAVEKALTVVANIEKSTVKLVVNVDALTQVVAGVKSYVGERLDEAVNQLVASQQDIIGWLRKVTDKAGAGREGKDGASLSEEARHFSNAEKVVAEDVRQVIQMIVAGETAKAVEALSTIYKRLAPASEENTPGAPAAGEGTRKRTAGLRSSWQAEKREVEGSK
jgi:hypothetical protein